MSRSPQVEFYSMKVCVLKIDKISHRNPTPNTDDLINTIWPAYSPGSKKLMEIGHDLVVRENREKLKIWHEFQERFTGHL